MITVEAAVQTILDDLMVTTAVSSPFDMPVIIDKLNEALRHCRSRIIDQDPEGRWFSEESGWLVYPANTRWSLFTALSATLYAPDRLYCVRLQNSTGSGQSADIEVIDARDELEWIWGSDADRYCALIRGEKLGIRRGQSEDPPASALNIRLIYEPIPTPINRAAGGTWTIEKAKFIGTDFPFPKAFTDVVVAYATVLLAMKQEIPTNQWESRYNGLEKAMLSSLRKGRDMGAQSKVMAESASWFTNQ
jgi:hypothetical protein